MKETAAAKLWRELYAAHYEEFPDFWNLYRGERHEFGEYDWFEWDLGKMPEGHVLIFKYYTWADAWDWVAERMPTEREALRLARKQTKIAERAYKKSQKRHAGRADAEEVYKDVERAQ